ncbi:hypothetical protein [Micromonospora luteifusca]|uniref:hypothetical protein n=1 Tax=Micromonospora luteifusca TaxID=709860 RepID=UPI0033B720A4
MPRARPGVSGGRASGAGQRAAARRGVALETGGVLVSRKIKIEIEGEAVRQA